MRATHVLRRSLGMLAVAAICSLSMPASAQYFGRNKVQYRTFDFQVLKTEHFDIYYYPSEQAGVDIAVRMAERWNVRLERLLQHRLRGRQPLMLYASHVDFEQTNVISGELGEGTGGVTESEHGANRIPETTSLYHLSRSVGGVRSNSVLRDLPHRDEKSWAFISPSAPYRRENERVPGTSLAS